MKGYFEFQEVQEYGSQFVKLVPTRKVPDEPEKVFGSAEDIGERIIYDMREEQ